MGHFFSYIQSEILKWRHDTRAKTNKTKQTKENKTNKAKKKKTHFV